MKSELIIKKSEKEILCILLILILVFIQGVQADDNPPIIVMVNESFTLECSNFNLDTGQPSVGYVSELVKWNNVSWETSPVVGSGITDSTGWVYITITEKYSGTYYYKFYFDHSSWSNLVTVIVQSPDEIKISYSPNPVTINTPITFDGSGSYTSGIPSYAWVFDDNNEQPSGVQVTHTYTKPGVYYPQLSINDDLGYRAGLTRVVVSNSLSVTGILPTNGEAGKDYLNLEIIGTGFTPESYVNFVGPMGTFSPNNIRIINSNRLRCDLSIPVEVPAGRYSVQVHNSPSDFAELSNSFEVTGGAHGSISGQVFSTDMVSSGQIQVKGVPDAEVWAANQKTGEMLDVVHTDQNGMFKIPNVPVGVYTLIARFYTVRAYKYQVNNVMVWSDEDTYRDLPEYFNLAMKASMKQGAALAVETNEKQWKKVQTQMKIVGIAHSITSIPSTFKHLQETVQAYKVTTAVFKSASANNNPSIMMEARYTLLKIIAKEMCTDAIITLANWVNPDLDPTISNLIEKFSTMRFWKTQQCLIDIMKDPPDMNYQSIYHEFPGPEIPELPINMSDPESSYLVNSYIRMANNYSALNVAANNTLITFERYQGAKLDNNITWQINQLSNLSVYIQEEIQIRQNIKFDIVEFKGQLNNITPIMDETLDIIQPDLVINGFDENMTANLTEMGFNESDIQNFRTLLINTNSTEILLSLDDQISVHNMRIAALTEFGDQVNLTLDSLTSNSAPPCVTNLNSTEITTSSINWTWDDPTDSDFNSVMIYVDGQYVTMIDKGIRYYNATGLIEGAQYTIGTRTVDLGGYVNSTWINNTQNTITIPPVAGFSMVTSSVFFPVTIQFTDTSTGSPTAWNWSFGDGTYSELQNPVHAYTTEGNVTISLKVTNAAGYDVVAGSVYINIVQPRETYAQFITSVDYRPPTTADAISSGEYPCNVVFNQEVRNIADISHSTLTNLSFTVHAQNITGVNNRNYAIWNSSVVTWQYPSNVTIPENGTVISQTITNLLSTRNVSISMERSMNQTWFTGPGVQLVQVNVTFDMTNCSFISGHFKLSKDQREVLDARILGGTFETDAPVQYIETNDSSIFQVRLDRSQIQTRRPYQFNIAISLNPANATPVKFKPSISFWHGFVQENRDGEVSGIAVAPSDMLPQYVTYSSASVFESTNWTYQNSQTIGAQLYPVMLYSKGALFANFTANITSGTAPLPVSFTDLSLNSPTGWVWYFGDETFTETWTLVNGSAGWAARQWHSSVAIPYGSIVLTGGWDGSNKNDVWRSTDNGATWAQVNASAGWSARHAHSSVVMPDRSIVLIGGVSAGIYMNDTWHSMDNGTTWVQVNASAGWPGRASHSSVVMPDGSIVLMGGYDGIGRRNDTWRSTNNGATWTQMTASAGWSARSHPSSVALPDGSIILMGGYDGSSNWNDTWCSRDNGVTWTQMNASAGWSARGGHSSVVVADGSIVLMGGNSNGTFKNDVWRSTDYGATWTQVNASAGWSARGYHSSVAMPGGSIVLMGGKTTDDYKNDVWMFMPVGSSAKNPSHTYTMPGIYQVSLRAYNAGGFNSTRKIGYITVMGSLAPVVNFIANTTVGTTPLIARFTDISTGSPTCWNWSFGDGFTSTNQNPVHTYANPGTYTVSLNASNHEDSNTTTLTSYITVYPKGDFNGNWRVDIGDVTSVAYMAVGLIPKDPNANFKGYGVVDGADAAKIAYYYVGKVSGL
jgi:PKD repeat protein